MFSDMEGVNAVSDEFNFVFSIQWLAQAVARLATTQMVEGSRPTPAASF